MALLLSRVRVVLLPGGGEGMGGVAAWEGGIPPGRWQLLSGRSLSFGVGGRGGASNRLRISTVSFVVDSTSQKERS